MINVAFVLLGLAALLASVAIVWFGVSYLTLWAVGRMFPLTRPRANPEPGTLNREP